MTTVTSSQRCWNNLLTQMPLKTACKKSTTEDRYKGWPCQIRTTNIFFVLVHCTLYHIKWTKDNQLSIIHACMCVEYCYWTKLTWESQPSKLLTASTDMVSFQPWMWLLCKTPHRKAQVGLHVGHLVVKRHWLQLLCCPSSVLTGSLSVNNFLWLRSWFGLFAQVKVNPIDLFWGQIFWLVTGRKAQD